jgi:hypothetical protein
MKEIIKIVLMVGVLLGIVSCATIYVVPYVDNKYTVTAFAENEIRANQIVANEAQKICERQNAQVKAIDHKCIYQGINSDQQELVDFAYDVLPKSKTSGQYIPKDHTYRSTLIFKCS